MKAKTDALIVGAGPAGASAAIFLAHAGWHVTLVEQHAYPRQKVCGECIAAGNLALLDELGVGQAFRRLAGPELKHVGWMRGDNTVVSDMPASSESAARYGRAVGRDVFDVLLVDAARAAGVHVVQPARVHNVRGGPGDYRCELEHVGRSPGARSQAETETLCAAVIIDAHGSWESGPAFEADKEAGHRARKRVSDLFAFKASYTQSTLTPGWLPVVSIEGGYGGLVVAEGGRTTLALCIRRDALRALRVQNSGMAAGVAVETYIRQSCRGVGEALRGASRKGAWLIVGPLRPGMRLNGPSGVFRVGNAAGESHPLIGEGISMALQGSKLLATSLTSHADRVSNAQCLDAAQQAYARAWRSAFLPRMRFAALYAQLAMSAPLAGSVNALLQYSPMLLTTAARFAGKARRAIKPPTLREERI